MVWGMSSGFMGDTSVKIVERECVKRLSTTVLNSIDQGQIWQHPCTKGWHVKNVENICVCGECHDTGIQLSASVCGMCERTQCHSTEFNQPRSNMAAPMHQDMACEKVVNSSECLSYRH